VALSLTLIALPRPAGACGGLFCNQGPSNTTVIDQNAERIVFVKGRETVKAYIQVQYQGEPVDFAWVVPVQARPTLSVADPSIFNAFDQATAPQFVFPGQTFDGSAGACGPGAATAGCGMAADGAAAGDEAFRTDGDEDPDGTTAVWGTDNVGPYETAIITADEPEDLTDWLADHDYTVPPEAYGLIAQYVEEGQFFVAIRLQAQAGIDLIQPLVIEYAGPEPCVPLRLTQVAAQPDMGVLIWIVSDAQAYPYNYARALVEHDFVSLDSNTGTTNYLDMVTLAVDSAGSGRAFVTEYAQPVSAVPDLSSVSVEAERIVRQGAYLTRLYTRISPQEMTIDPIFEMDPDLADVSNVHDFTQPGASAGILAPRRGRAYAAALGSGLPLAVALGLAVTGRRRARR
jgi:hypothetical protein